MKTPRVVIGTDTREAGWHGLRVSRQGHSALINGPDAYGRVNFDTDWGNLEGIHQAGITSARFRYDFRPPSGGSARVRAFASVEFPELPYRPMVSLRRCASDGATIYGDEWWTAGSGGTDNYYTFMYVMTSFDKFAFTGTTFNSGNQNWPLHESYGPHYFSYIVWAIPADRL